MQFSIRTQAQYPQGARLWVSTNANDAPNEFAAVARKLSDDNHFAHADVIVDGNLHAVGVAVIEHLDIAAIQKLARDIASWAQQYDTLSIDLNALSSTNAAQLSENLLVALGEAVYRFDQFKHDATPPTLTNAEIIYADTSALNDAGTHARALITGMNLCKDLGNAPSNVCTPTYLAHTAAQRAQELGAQAKILGRDYIEANMPSFWSVAKGSVQEPQLLELSYFGAADASAAPIVLVGKGVTFDTGGISLKGGEAMDEMKFDMCGAASVIGAFIAAVEAKLPINLKTIVVSCENMPDGNSCKPGDIVAAMNGTTIENLNTDAEGRLILCDALTYAEQFQPRAVIDVATLTGACIIALGHVASGLLSNNQDLADALLNASRQCNDKAWQMPLFEEYRDQLKSNFADMQNIGGRAAGTITAATFLAHFAQNYTWAHLDIAGTAWKSGKDKGATGRPVPLLFQYLKNQAA